MFCPWRWSKLSCTGPEQPDLSGAVWQIVFFRFDIVCKVEQKLLIFRENMLGSTGISSVLNVGRDIFLNTFLSSVQQHCNC